MQPKTLIGLVCLLALSACSGGERVAPDMADACQLKPCVCAEDSASIFGGETAELLWHPDGRAYCPEGHHLELVSED